MIIKLFNIKISYNNQPYNNEYNIKSLIIQNNHLDRIIYNFYKTLIGEWLTEYNLSLHITNRLYNDIEQNLLINELLYYTLCNNLKIFNEYKMSAACHILIYGEQLMNYEL